MNEIIKNTGFFYLLFFFLMLLLIATQPLYKLSSKLVRSHGNSSHW